MKLMAAGGVAACFEEVPDTFQFFIVLEEQDVISHGDVSKLHDLLMNEELKDKVRKYECKYERMSA